MSGLEPIGNFDGLSPFGSEYRGRLNQMAERVYDMARRWPDVIAKLAEARNVFPGGESVVAIGKITAVHGPSELPTYDAESVRGPSLEVENKAPINRVLGDSDVIAAAVDDTCLLVREAVTADGKDPETHLIILTEPGDFGQCPPPEGTGLRSFNGERSTISSSLGSSSGSVGSHGHSHDDLIMYLMGRVGGTVPMWRKYTVSYTQLAVASTTTTVTLFTRPASGIIQAVVVRGTGFSGGKGSPTTVTCSVGDSGSAFRYASAHEVGPPLASVDTSYMEQLDWTANGAGVGLDGTSDIIATFTGDTNLNTLTVGSVDIYVLWGVA